MLPRPSCAWTWTSCLGRTCVILGVDCGPLTGGDAARSGLGWRVEWLLEGQRDGGAEQLEGSGLDGGVAGELLDLLPGEDDGLPVEGGQVLDQVEVDVGR